MGMMKNQPPSFSSTTTTKKKLRSFFGCCVDASTTCKFYAKRLCLPQVPTKEKEVFFFFFFFSLFILFKSNLFFFFLSLKLAINVGTPGSDTKVLGIKEEETLYIAHRISSFQKSFSVRK
jgi:hypothetical protein